MTRPPSNPSRAAERCLSAGEIELDSPQATVMLGADLISDDEVVILLLRPSILYIPLSAMVSLICIALITFALAYLARLTWVGWTDTQAFALGFFLAALRLGWQTLEWWSRVYILTDKRVIRRFGVIRTAVFETPLKNIQHTSIVASLRERIFDLGTIGFATSGSDIFDAWWVMVRKPYAVHKTVIETIRKYGRGQK